MANWAQLLEGQAVKLRDKTFLYLVYQDRNISYAEMDLNANRVANYLLRIGAKPGDGIATLMNNSPQFLDIFFGIQKIGMYVNTVNTSLRGDQLAYTVDNSDTKYLVVDYDLLDVYDTVKDRLGKVERVLVNTLEAPAKFSVPAGMTDLKDAYAADVPTSKPAVTLDENGILMLMYTSGTTGLPKGVVNRYNKNAIDRVKPLAGILLKPDSIYYTALQLFHGNALFITITGSLLVGCTVALSKKFSASKFWEEVARSKATIFNTIGAIIPILMKTPESPYDKNHCVKSILSAGCPAILWEPFEQRFGVKIWEAYAAIDGSGFIANFGDGPKGSIGKPLNSIVKLVNEHGNEVLTGDTGELLFKVDPNKKSSVEYYKNPDASGEKTKGEWEYTGDLMYQDAQGYIYFVGRNTDSMRRRGENVSAYDVEQAILKHPSVVEAAVYPVPSEMTEDEIMASVKFVDGQNLTGKEVFDFLQDKLAKFAIPRYIRIVDDFPRTETFRIKKGDLKSIGVTADTFDAEKG
ncbi:MAG TPA: AMP-binding protein [Deltaproteobacteria bacterium]|mgnify:CR=1 FL=1|nr:AMP-binding protein [Deltaproteobacteria bacterium]